MWSLARGRGQMRGLITRICSPSDIANVHSRLRARSSPSFQASMSTSLYVHTFPPDLARLLSAHLNALVDMPLAPSPVIQRALPSLVASLQLWQLHMLDEAARILARHKRICARAGSEGRSVVGSQGEGSNGEVRTSRERGQEAKNGQGRVQDTRDEDWVLAQDDIKWLEGVLKRREAKEIRSEGSFMTICIWVRSRLAMQPALCM
jgi:hypothetical protein